MANLTNLYRAGDDLRFSVSITDSRRILIPDSAPQIIEISAQQVLADGSRGNFWNFGTNAWDLASEPTLENVPETDLSGPTPTGEYEITLTGAYYSGLNDVHIHLKGSGTDKSDFYYRDHIDNGELIDDILARIIEAETTILNKLSSKGFRRERPSRQELMDSITETTGELTDLRRMLRNITGGLKDNANQ